MTTGDGGMICSNDFELLNDVRAMRWVGIDKDNWKTAQEYTKANKDAMHWFYELNILGYKYNMNDLAASIGLVQLMKLPEMNKRRSQIISNYIDGLNNVDNVDLLIPYKPNKYIYHVFGIRVDTKDEIIIHLKGKGIATGCHYTPLHMQPLFKPYKSNCPVAEREYFRFMTLPYHVDLTDEEIDYVLAAIEDWTKKK